MGLYGHYNLFNFFRALESDVYGRQILTSKDYHRAEKLNIPGEQDPLICVTFGTLCVNEYKAIYPVPRMFV